MSDFEVHWCRVRGPQAAAHEAEGRILCALWPAPVNADECFTAAGFTRFGDADDTWDARAGALLDRLLSDLGTCGAPRLLSAPLRAAVPWYARILREGVPLELREQILQPMHWDSLPRCRVAFGDQGHELFAGDGHHIHWFTLRGEEEARLPERIARIAGPWPTLHTELAWEHLLRSGVTDT